MDASYPITKSNKTLPALERVMFHAFRFGAFVLMLNFFFFALHSFESRNLIGLLVFGVHFMVCAELVEFWGDQLRDKARSKPFQVITHPNLPLSQWMHYPRGEYVYVIEDVSNSFYFKIGRTSHPYSRLSRFGVILPIVIHVIHIIPCANSAKAESELHLRFRSQRKRGEWFALSNADVEWLKSIERL